MENSYLSGRSIEKERFIKATPQRVFEALTKKEELERWFVQKAEVDLHPEGRSGTNLRLIWLKRAGFSPMTRHIALSIPGKPSHLPPPRSSLNCLRKTMALVCILPTQVSAKERIGGITTTA